MSSGRVETYPFRVPMSLGARAALIKTGARLRAAVAEYQRVGQKRPGESDADVRKRVLEYRGDTAFSEFVGNVPAEVDGLLRATINRSTGESEDVSAGCGIGYFALVWSKGGGLSRNIIGGSSILTGAIASRLGRASAARSTGRGDHPRCRRRPRTLHAGRRAQALTARYAIVATPAHVTARIAGCLPTETIEALSAIPYGPYALMAVLTDETRRMPWDDIYALATPGRSFNMLFNHANVLRPRSTGRQPGGSLMVYAGAKLAGPLLEDAVTTRSPTSSARISVTSTPS